MDCGNEPPSRQGQLLRRSERREVAIYLRKGPLWIVDFVDGVGELIDPPTWFRFNCGTSWARKAHRRMLFESATPLSAELAERIERLHISTAQPAENDPTQAAAKGHSWNIEAKAKGAHHEY